MNNKKDRKRTWRESFNRTKVIKGLWRRDLLVTGIREVRKGRDWKVAVGFGS